MLSQEKKTKKSRTAKRKRRKQEKDETIKENSKYRDRRKREAEPP